MGELTAFQRDLLVVLAGTQRPSGTAVMDELGHYYHDDIEAGRLYPNLDDLVEADLVSKESVDGRTNAYLLTDEGERRLRSRLEWQSRHLPARVEEAVDGSV